MTRALSLIALIALTSCVPEDTGGPSERGRLSNAERVACELDGGRVGIAGLQGGEFCIRPAPDAGQACSRASDCTAWCQAETRTCAAELNPFGCRFELTDEGEELPICVD